MVTNFICTVCCPQLENIYVSVVNQRGEAVILYLQQQRHPAGCGFMC